MRRSEATRTPGEPIVRNAERDLPKQAGAEDEIPDRLFPCD